jgi:hypothetical protein
MEAHNLNKQKLSPQQESELVDYIKELSKRGLSPTREMMQRFASEIGNCYIGNGWFGRFLGRNKHHLTSRWTNGINTVCYKADLEVNYRLYFDRLHLSMEEYGIEPRYTYNMDEKGFMIGVLGKSKRIFSKVSWQSWESKEARAPIKDGSCEWITMLAAVCADGEALPPSLIYQAESGNVRSTLGGQHQGGKAQGLYYIITLWMDK